MDSTTTPNVNAASNQSMTSARVLLGTIAATGALALTAIVAMAPEQETFLLLTALALPWLTVALFVGLHFLIRVAPSRGLHTTPPPAQQLRPATGILRPYDGLRRGLPEPAWYSAGL